MTDTPEPSFVRRVHFAPGATITIPATHVAQDGGYALRLGIGRQLPTYLPETA